MTSLTELLDWLRGLGPHDLSLAVAARELVRRADPGGAADRGEWVASMREAYEDVAYRRDPSGFPNPAPEGEGVGPYLEQHVIARLEAAGVARREPSTEGWERLRIDPVLWAELEPRKPEIVEELRGLVRVLQEAQAPNPVATQVETLPAGGSRLRADGLVKVYRKRKVVNDVAISVAQGEIVALLGPNGAGKTTTFYMIVGLIPPDEGRVHLDEADITETPMYQRARMGVGYLAQEPSIFRKLTVAENVLAILETLDLPKDEEKRRLEELLNELSIAHLRTSKAYSLSGGERRRLEITRALVQRPKFILLDEPFAGIDPIAVGDIQKIVADLKKRGIGVIISDHNVEQTLEIVDRAYIMYEGRIRVSGTVSELVWSEEVAEIYLGPTMTARMRKRYPRPESEAVTT
jgi:lipopolysaccharide export system ATP-binding protein